MIGLRTKMKELNGRILGVDYGKKRIGVAVSDPFGTIASGLPTIVYQNLPEALTQLEQIIAQFQVCAIVVGLPLTLKGEEGAAAHDAKVFIEKLKSTINVPVYTWDERFTSVLAERSLQEMGKSPSRNKEKVDQLSATFLLQSYLDKRSLTIQ